MKEVIQVVPVLVPVGVHGVQTAVMMEILSSSKSSIDVRGYPGYDNNICDIDTEKG